MDQQKQQGSIIDSIFKESKQSLKDWLKSQAILSTITFVALMIGLYLLKVEHWILISVCFTIVDLLPVLGLGICMIPWAAYEIFIQDNTKLGLWIFLLFVIIMVIRQILEPFVRGKSLGISPLEEVAAAVIGYLVFGMNGLGLVLGPVIYIVGKKAYRTFVPSSTIEGGGSTPYFNRGFTKPNHNKQADVIDITDDVVDVDESQTKS